MSRYFLKSWLKICQTFFLCVDGLQWHKVEDLCVGVRLGDEVDDVDDVSRGQHAGVVGDLLQHLRRRVAVDDDANKCHK